MIMNNESVNNLIGNWKVKTILLYVIVIILFGFTFFIGYSVKQCDCDVMTEEEKQEKLEKETNEKFGYILIDYFNEENEDKLKNGEFKADVYKFTLKEFKEKGYDTSMFVNSETKKQCDLEDTYLKLSVLGKDINGELQYTFTVNISCDN